MKKIILTGGGTAGHVTPNIALLPALKEADYDIRYIGSYRGMEKELIEAAGIPYYGISSGKLRFKKYLRPVQSIKRSRPGNPPAAQIKTGHYIFQRRLRLGTGRFGSQIL